MKIEILGVGCPKCKQLTANAEEAVKELDIQAEIDKVTDINKITEYGVMMTPGLVIAGKKNSYEIGDFMVKLLVVVLTAFAVIGAGSLVIGEDNEQDKVIAYYFHGNTRCYSCNILEQYSRQAIEDNFQDELASNRLIFKTVNVQEKANDHFRKDYGLYSQSLVLSLIENGREKKFL